MQYTDSDLQLFRALAAQLARGESIDSGLALPFAVRDWLRQSGTPLGWEVTQLGKEHIR